MSCRPGRFHVLPVVIRVECATPFRDIADVVNRPCIEIVLVLLFALEGVRVIRGNLASEIRICRGIANLVTVDARIRIRPGHRKNYPVAVVGIKLERESVKSRLHGVHRYRINPFGNIADVVDRLRKERNVARQISFDGKRVFRRGGEEDGFAAFFRIRKIVSINAGVRIRTGKREGDAAVARINDVVETINNRIHAVDGVDRGRRVNGIVEVEVNLRRVLHGGAVRQIRLDGYGILDFTLAAPGLVVGLEESLRDVGLQRAGLGIDCHELAHQLRFAAVLVRHQVDGALKQHFLPVNGDPVLLVVGIAPVADLDVVSGDGEGLQLEGVEVVLVGKRIVHPHPACRCSRPFRIVLEHHRVGQFRPGSDIQLIAIPFRHSLVVRVTGNVEHGGIGRDSRAGVVGDGIFQRSILRIRSSGYS